MQARAKAGLTLDQAARRARITPAYLRHIERCGAPYTLAVRLAHIYRCSIHLFLYPGLEGQPERPQSLSKGRNPSKASSQNESKQYKEMTGLIPMEGIEFK
jgi:transcriptional regulator with XRE-family HTH domain